MKKIYTLIGLLLAGFTGFSQGGVVSAVFTASDGLGYLRIDSLRILNLDRSCDTMLIYPDTSIVFGYTGLPEDREEDAQLRIWQNFPDPLNTGNDVRIWSANAGRLDLRLTGLWGTQASGWSGDILSGTHTFRLTGTNSSWHVLSAYQNGHFASAKVPGSGSAATGSAGIVYLGNEKESYPVKSTGGVTGGFAFKAGDSLLYIGYYDTLQAGIYDRPDSSSAVTFLFSYNQPCPGIPTVEYEGKTYHTVQIFNQCWMKENLNVGVMIAGATGSSDNGIIEKYCYGDVEDSCAALGAFYQWNEMMAYATTPGSRGICPPGWRIPTDDDWKILEGESDSLYKVGNSAWDSSGVRGITAGYILKGPAHWENQGNGSDIYGFTVPPSGYRDSWGYIFGYGHAASYWCADQKDAVNAWSRGFGCHGREVSRFDMEKASGYSVRCLHD